jgi:hypothetical protein
MEDENARIMVHLCFSGFSADPSSISAMLDLEPVALHRVGDARIGTNVVRKRSFWATELMHSTGTDVGLAIAEAVKQIASRASAISQITGQVTDQSYLGVAVTYRSNKPFINISSDVIMNIAAMSLALDIELFPITSDDEAGAG